jgi:hypothetical protein
MLLLVNIDVMQFINYLFFNSLNIKIFKVICEQWSRKKTHLSTDNSLSTSLERQLSINRLLTLLKIQGQFNSLML